MIKLIRNYFRNLRRNSDNKFIYKINLYYELFVKEKNYIKKRTYSE